MTGNQDIDALVRLAVGGDKAALSELLARHRERLLRMVQLRIDPRVRERVGASDVVQEACIEALQRFEEFARAPAMPFPQWLRFLTGQKLLQVHRRNLDARCRDVRAEQGKPAAARPSVSSESLGDWIEAGTTSPSLAAERAEQRQRLMQVLDGMDPLDREVLVMRHFEQLNNVEVAAELGLQTSAASKRYLRALTRLQQAVGPQMSA